MSNDTVIRRRAVTVTVSRRRGQGATVTAQAVGGEHPQHPVTWLLGDSPVSVDVEREIGAVFDAMIDWCYAEIGVRALTLF